ncbi:hypothetical protein [Methanobacterium paludis]|uniref:Uncharacterized protein n=1 Tax=Methanobacterium paludis (strain DSM 25820 / JCM 18151 / SWAN1) TaxID=868131 RepID=F6D2R7_METPW|nr:hypothetical protein [Methanobacterium paludis]AEG18646.1 hypothetical protein MSWAN_1635 [Methanobacterium paludis]
MTSLLKKEFTFKMPITKSYEGNDGYYHIEFGISSDQDDLQDDYMTKNAINDIVKQAKGLGFNPDTKAYTGINIDDYHKDGLRSLIGPVVDSWEEKQGVSSIVYVDLKVRKEWEDTIRDIIDTGLPLGGSITGSATKTLPRNKEGKRGIDGIELYKAALTDIPAAWDTRGTARAVEKACPMCNQIMKSLDLEKIKKSDYVVNQTCLDFAKEQINDGNVNNGPWSKPLFSDFDSDIDEYKKYALAVHPDMDAELSGSYGFEIGKNGKIYRQGVISAKTAAAGGMSSAGKNTALYDAADELLKLIDDDENKKSIGGNHVKVKKDVITVDNAFETIQAEINGALDQRYGTPSQYGGYNRNCQLQYTQPDSIIVSDSWNLSNSDDIYKIPYTRETKDNGDTDVKLGDPVRISLQMVTKSLEESKWVIKAVKPKNRGGNVTDKSLELPEDLKGMDEGILKKIKEGGDEVKQFFKGLLGIEEPTQEPGLEPGPNGGAGDPAPTTNGGVVVDKNINMEKKVNTLEKTVEDQDKLIKTQGTMIDTLNKRIEKKDHNILVSKALEMHKKLNPVGPEEPEPNYTEEDLTKALVEEYGLTEEEVKEDLDKAIKDGSRIMKGILKRTPDGDIPDVFDDGLKKDADKYAKEEKALRAELDKQGRE